MNENIKNIYFIGIGGIGMSALARYFHAQGATVSGYDRTPSALTREMEAAGMPVHYTEDVAQIPQQPDLVVYTPAIPREHAELQYYRNSGARLMKRSEVLGLITRQSFNICVAGTHGKTTTSSMVAHILRHTGYGCNAFLGGITVNYNTNFWSNEKNVCVVEADEFDRSFLQLSPDIAIVSSMDPDHLDIYGTPEAMEAAFVEFTQKIKPGGLLIVNRKISNDERLQGNKIAYGIAAGGTGVYAAGIQPENGSYRFSLHHPAGRIDNIVLNIGGLHNVENITAAIMVALHLGIPEEKIRAAVMAFRGVRRRFEYVLKTEKLVMIDDYAHHPEELRALISGVESLFPQHKKLIVFQPHLYSRTQDLAAGFTEVLSLADEVVLLPIYPARELPIPGVSSELLLNGITQPHKCLVEKNALPALLHEKIAGIGEPVALMMAGAGDIDLLVEPVKQKINELT